MNTQKEAAKLAGQLLAKKLIFDGVIVESEALSIGLKGAGPEQTKYTIRARTRALLFEAIQQEVKKNYPHEMPAIFATPIVYMDTDQALDLRKNTRSV